MEAYAANTHLFGGLRIAALAWIWLLIRAFRQAFGGAWAVCSCRRWPSCFRLRHAQKAIGPLVLFILGGLSCWRSVSYSLVSPVDLGLRESYTRGQALVACEATHSKATLLTSGWIQGVLHSAWWARYSRLCLDLAACTCVPAASTMGIGQFGVSAGGISLRGAASRRELHR